MHINRRRRCLQGRKPIVIILRVERFDMTHGGKAVLHRKAMLFAAHRILKCNRPTIRARHDGHSIRSQDMKLQRVTCLILYGFNIPIPRQQNLTKQGLQKLRLTLAEIGPCNQAQDGMYVKSRIGILQHQG